MTVSDRFEAELAHEGYDNCEGELRELFDKIQIFIQAKLEVKADGMLLALGCELINDGQIPGWVAKARKPVLA